MSNDSRDRRRGAGSLLSFGAAPPAERGNEQPQPQHNEGPSPLLAALADVDRRAAEEAAAAAGLTPRHAEMKSEPASRAPS
ncbi:hypothetical protein AB4144_62455, partial [Rhizobiaceae sp. 2RAB30]